MLKRLLWLVVGVAVAAALLVDAVPAAYVLGPLLALGILRLGLATFRSMVVGGEHIPTSEPTPVDPARECVRYWCEGCGAEMLLLMRGTPLPPRHCGQRMEERVDEVSELQGNPEA